MASADYRPDGKGGFITKDAFDRSMRVSREEQEIGDLDRAVRRKKLLAESGEVSQDEAEAWQNNMKWRGSSKDRQDLVDKYGGVSNIPGVGTKVVNGKKYRVDDELLPTAKGYGTKWF